jgi:hypothetical protein
MTRTEILAAITSEFPDNSTGAITAAILRDFLADLAADVRLPEDLCFKLAARAFAASNVTQSGTQTIDGVALVAGDRVLCGGQSSGGQNGLWTVAAGAWTRTTDADEDGEIMGGMFVPIAEGTTYGGRLMRLTTTGTIVVGTTALTFTRFPSETVGLQFVVDGGGVALTTGVKGFLEVPFAMTISQVTLLADTTGSVVVDIWKDTYANFPPTVADTITAAAKPTITAATKAKDSTLTGWTTAVAAGDVLAFNVDSAATITRLTISLSGTKV